MDKPMLDKLILLFVFDKFEVPLREELVLEIADGNKWIPYIDCKIALDSIAESGFVTNVSQNKNSKRYMITADGRECLSSFYTNIPSSLRQNISEHVKENRVAYRKKQDYTADYFRNSDQSFTVKLRIESTSVQLMEITLIVQNRNNAKWIYRNWPEKAPMIYEYIHDNLLEP